MSEEIDYEHVINDLKMRHAIDLERLESENRVLREALEAAVSRDKPRPLPNLTESGVVV